MQSLWRFLSYNNAVPIALTILLSGAGATFAATNPETIYDTEQTVVAVDNSYIATKDLNSYTPRLEILGVTEDAETYYVAYRLSSIDIVDSVWQDVTRDDVLSVAKGVLGEYGDLGLYATEQFKQIVDRQSAYLREVQDIEKRAISTKIVATAYSGLVGRFLDDTTESLPGYVPVVTPPVEVVLVMQADPPTETPGEVAGVNDPVPPVQEPTPTEPPPTPSNTSNPPTIQILGDNPVRIVVGGTYTDLGVVVTDDSDASPTLRKFVNGSLTSGPITIDTSAAKEVRIRYEATDSDTNTATAERIVNVVDPTPTNPPPQTPPASTTPATTTPAAPAPDPEPEPTPVVTPDPESEPTPEPESTPAPEEPPLGE